jgi:putative transposase
MPYYRRFNIAGGTFFFTVVLADRSSDLLVRQMDRLRNVYQSVQRKYPFETVAICILPDHIHAIWSLPDNDSDFPKRWQLIKSGISRGVPAAVTRSASKAARREKGIWQRRYWEHLIRDDDDLSRHVDYIHFNPVNRPCHAGRRLATQHLPPLCRPRRSTQRLGWRHAGDCRYRRMNSQM